VRGPSALPFLLSRGQSSNNDSASHCVVRYNCVEYEEDSNHRGDLTQPVKHRRMFLYQVLYCISENPLLEPTLGNSCPSFLAQPIRAVDLIANTQPIHATLVYMYSSSTVYAHVLN
jgi:hypothetical protein